MIESILENLPWSPTAAGGTLTTAIGSANAVGLTGCAAGDIIIWTDDAGADRMSQLSAANTFHENAVSAATAVTATKIVVGSRTCPWFKADNSILSAPLVKIEQNLLGGVLYSGGGTQKPKIDADEGFLIKSIYVRFPYQYTLGDRPLRIQLSYLDNTLAAGSVITTIGEADGSIFIPVENIEIPVNAYAPPMSGTTGFYYVAAQVVQALDDISDADVPYQTPHVSQVNAPDTFNLLYLPLYVGIRILHAGTALIA